jgi:hypothetical protein
MKTRIFLIFLLFIVPAIKVKAQSTPSLVVWQKNGEKVIYELYDLPETTFEDDKLVIKTNRTTVYYLLENVIRYTYQGLESIVDQIPNIRSVSINRNSDAITFGNLPQGSIISLCAANGMVLENYIANGKPLTISIASRPSGVYILNVGKESIKMLKP